MTILKLSELLIKLMEKKGVSPKVEIFVSIRDEDEGLSFEHMVHRDMIKITGITDQLLMFKRIEETSEEF